MPGGLMINGGNIQQELNNLMAAFGAQHQGHVGRTEGNFKVDTTEEHFLIRAELPGYHLSSAGLDPHNAAASPLSVRAVGHRTLVVSGMQQYGDMIRQWQRSFSLPTGSDLEHVQATYSSGVLTVDVPRNGTREEDPVDDFHTQDEMLPPALRALMEGLPGIMGSLGQVPRRGGGFLGPDFIPDHA
nr:small heat shock protein sHsp19.9 [Dinophyceae sp.]